VRGLERETATRVFAALLRFAETGEGDVKKLQGSSDDLRLRVGDYRVRFTLESDGELRIHSVRHRKDAYR
jgi:mRNA interferase RelE/StbE